MSSVSALAATTVQAVTLSADVKIALANLKNSQEQLAQSVDILAAGTATRGVTLDLKV
jgi:hypothetical protein